MKEKAIKKIVYVVAVLVLVLLLIQTLSILGHWEEKSIVRFAPINAKELDEIE